VPLVFTKVGGGCSPVRRATICGRRLLRALDATSVFKTTNRPGKSGKAGAGLMLVAATAIAAAPNVAIPIRPMRRSGQLRLLGANSAETGRCL
jgi:hypothetical protein